LIRLDAGQCTPMAVGLPGAPGDERGSLGPVVAEPLAPPACCSGNCPAACRGLGLPCGRGTLPRSARLVAVEPHGLVKAWRTMTWGLRQLVVPSRSCWRPGCAKPLNQPGETATEQLRRACPRADAACSPASTAPAAASSATSRASTNPGFPLRRRGGAPLRQLLKRSGPLPYPWP